MRASHLPRLIHVDINVSHIQFRAVIKWMNVSATVSLTAQAAIENVTIALASPHNT